MYRFTGMYRFCLRNKISSVFSIIIGPAVHFGYIAGPVTMTRVDWRSPLERICPPWIRCSHFSSCGRYSIAESLNQDSEAALLLHQFEASTERHTQERSRGKMRWALNKMRAALPRYSFSELDIAREAAAHSWSSVLQRKPLRFL